MFYDAAAVDRLLPYGALIAALAKGLQTPCVTPLRGVHKLDEAGSQLLLMPAWQDKQAAGVKLLTVFPGNPAQSKATIQGVYVLFDGKDGSPSAVLDGTRMTLRRTAALCALGTQSLAPAKADTLLVVGTGALAPHVVQAHVAERAWSRIKIWGRNTQAGQAMAADLRQMGIAVEIASDLEAAVRSSSVVSTATASRVPLLKADWLSAGQHINMLGAYTEQMHEAEPEVIARCAVFVDDRESVLAESGEVIAALRQGLISESALLDDISTLVSAPPRPRASAAEITLFKSVGFGALDLIAAHCLADRAAQ
jgi:ornithine cyclodeaminase